MTKELKQEYTLRITQANKTQLAVILYEMTITYLEEASRAYDEGDTASFKDSIRKARGCIKELIASLKFTAAVCVCQSGADQGKSAEQQKGA